VEPEDEDIQDVQDKPVLQEQLEDEVIQVELDIPDILVIPERSVIQEQLE
jgi:hypothetical protein